MTSRSALSWGRGSCLELDMVLSCVVVFFQAEDGVRDLVRSRGLGDLYRRQSVDNPLFWRDFIGTFQAKN